MGPRTVGEQTGGGGRMEGGEKGREGVDHAGDCDARDRGAPGPLKMAADQRRHLGALFSADRQRLNGPVRRGRVQSTRRSPTGDVGQHFYWNRYAWERRPTLGCFPVTQNKPCGRFVCRANGRVKTHDLHYITARRFRPFWRRVQRLSDREGHVVDSPGQP